MYSLLNALVLYKTLKFSLLHHRIGPDLADPVHLHSRAAVLDEEVFQYKQIHEGVLEKNV
ncbi:hypothetical protein bcgnr5373_55550 [Bacillus cereus]